MAATVPGVYEQGFIRLLEIPGDLPEGRVLVTVEEDRTPSRPSSFLQRGKYSTGRFSTAEDFQTAEWRGEDESNGD